MADLTAAGIAGRRRAAGIYGAIVTAAILTAAGGQLATAPLTITVVVTLVVYWMAEEYAELLGGHVHDGKLPEPAQVLAELRATWPMVTASYLPLATLLVARLTGASPVTVANAGLVAAVLLLVYHAWSAARVAHLRGPALIGATCAAGLLGLVMVLMKNLVLVHLH